MALENDPAESDADGLRAWLGGAVGGSVAGWRRLVAGNSRTTWAADVTTAAGAVPVVVRVDAGDGPFSDTPLTLAREAGIYAAMQGRGVAIPQTFGFDPGLQALALARVPGAPAWDADVLDALLAELATLHTVDATSVALPGVAPTALDDLELWAGIAATRVAPRSPFADFAVEFLRARFPGEPPRLTIVHGDPGIGNLLWDGGRITALLDWELTHLGDPIDDLAFLTVRAGLFGVELPDFGARVREHYAPRAGVALDERRLHYWQAVGVLRNLVTCLASISNPARGRDRLVHHMLVPSLNRLLMGTLARIDGIALEPTEPLGPAPTLPGAAVMSELSRTVAELVATIPDEADRQRARRLRHLFGQLAETWPLAGEIARAEAAEPPPPAGDDDEARLRRLVRTADRELALFPRAAGLADVPLPGFG